jgi:hypothetical protein
MDYFNSGPRGSEVPEALLGLCIIIYTFTNLQKARYLSRVAVLPTGNQIAEQEPTEERT